MKFTRRQGDLVAAAGTMSFAAFLWLETLRMTSSATPYPRLLSVILAVCGVIMLVKALRQSADGTAVFGNVAWRTLAGAVAVWGLAIGSTTLFGTYPVIAAMIASLLVILGGLPRTPLDVSRTFGFALLVALALWLIFGQLLGVATPRGAFF